ncbi:MAG: phosphoglucosamine mutase, partial [Deltaproteobacteria bacterium]|nr:phosphoglucosamine mutase [Deltaproteobacteria bacterium]
MGADVWLVGPMPTPGIAFITHSMRADAGVVISASHNPFQDNGIKFFAGNGFKLPDETEAEIERMVTSNHIDSLRPTASAIGKAFRIDDAIGRYVVYLKNTFPKELDLEGIKLVVDCAHGATYRSAPAVFEELGAEVVPLGVKPNGQNINLNCGSLHPEVISRTARKHRAHMGVALDGDGDRAIFADEEGNVVDGDRIMAICAADLKARGKLAKNTLVVTVMSNVGLSIAMRERGISVVRTAVGDRYVVEEMVRTGCNLGGEQSGHLIFLDHSTTGDGTLAALQVLAIMQRSGKPLSELARIFTPLPQVLRNVSVTRKEDLHQFPSIIQAIHHAESRLGDRGRVLVRFSGTEPTARVMVEGEDESVITAMADEISGEIGQVLG